MQTVVSFSNVSKHFGKTIAVKNLSLEVKKGQSVALVGPNGAGKTTALLMLEGLRQPTSGRVELFGLEPGDPAAMARIGVTPQATNFPPQLTPKELLEFTCAHYENPRPVEELVATFGLEKFAQRPVSGFSGGERRRVALALCFAGNPELVILDEPTSGLDAKGQKHFQAIAKDFVARGNSLILTSHYWEEIENVANKIIMIDAGETVMDGNISDIKSAFGLNKISFTSTNPGKHIRSSFTLSGNQWSLVTNNSDQVIRDLVKSNEPFANLKVTPRGLEEAITIFRQNQTRKAA